MKKILILGGTRFIGRNLVETLRASDEYELTLFNRQTQEDLFPELLKIKGDRDTSDIHQIASQKWDYVIDLSCYFPNSLLETLKNLNQDVRKYIFVSTCSVYDNTEQSILRNEDAPILACSDAQRTDTSTASYGNRKAECERILNDSGFEHLILRPALVYGRYDYTDRFYYWIHQVVKSDRLLLPDHGQRQFSISYVQDLVRVIQESLLEPKLLGIYNIISTPKTSIGQIVDATQKLLEKDTAIINATPEFLHGQSVNQWSDMPLWIDNDYFTYSNRKLLEDFKVEPTSLGESLESTIAHYDNLNWPVPNFGMAEERRLELIGRLTME